MAIADEDLLIALAKLYYFDGLSHQEIADRVSLSRPTVSKLLKRCRDEGIVEIRIKESSSLHHVLEKEIKAAFGLAEAIVVPSGLNESRTAEETGRAASQLLARSLRDGLTIGISWGATTWNALKALDSAPQFRDIKVVQLVGAYGAINQSYEGYELASIIAQKLNGSYSTIQAPAVVRSALAREHFLREPGIAAALDMARQADVAILSVSPDDPEWSSLVRAGFITVAESEEFRASGAVGHSCGGIHFDIDGAVVRTPLNDRIVGISVEELREIPRVILAAYGSIKAEAILGALRSGIFHALATDESAALKVLALAKPGATR